MLIENYASPLGEIIISAHDGAICGLWFAGQKYEKRGIDESFAERPGDREVLEHCILWLDAYFSGAAPEIAFPLCPKGTAFQKKVWQELRLIPCGETATYGEIAERVGCKSARAVGGAVGKNPISILIPCHRVLGANSTLTGYAGGIERKIFLLDLEKDKVPRHN